MALERDEDIEGRASDDDQQGDDSWRQRHQQASAVQVQKTYTVLQANTCAECVHSMSVLQSL